MKCFLCGSSLFNGEMDCDLSVGGENIHIINIRFVRCAGCGEAFLSLKDVDLLLKIACDPSAFEEMEKI